MKYWSENAKLTPLHKLRDLGGNANHHSNNFMLKTLNRPNRHTNKISYLIKLADFRTYKCTCMCLTLFMNILPFNFHLHYTVVAQITQVSQKVELLVANLCYSNFAIQFSHLERFETARRLRHNQP